MKKFLWMVALIAALALCFSGCGSSSDDDDDDKKDDTTKTDITYTVTTNGVKDTTTSTKLIFAFSEDVTDLKATEITLTKGTGEVTKGALTGSGKDWDLLITVTTQGTITVAIAKEGIETAPKTVTVNKLGAGVNYTVSADGVAGTTTSTKLTFTFESDVSSLGLAAADIAITGTNVTKGTLAAGTAANTYDLSLATVTAPGYVTVKITKTGITPANKQALVNFADPSDAIGYTIDFTGKGNTATVPTIEFTFDEDVSSLALTEADIILIEGTGKANKGTLAANKLPIRVLTGGDINVQIIKAGVSSKLKPVTIEKKEIEVPADGEDGTWTWTKLTGTWIYDDEPLGKGDLTGAGFEAIKAATGYKKTYLRIYNELTTFDPWPGIQIGGGKANLGKNNANNTAGDLYNADYVDITVLNVRTGFNFENEESLNFNIYDGGKIVAVLLYIPKNPVTASPMATLLDEETGWLTALGNVTVNPASTATIDNTTGVITWKPDTSAKKQLTVNFANVFAAGGYELLLLEFQASNNFSNYAGIGINNNGTVVWDWGGASGKPSNLVGGYFKIPIDLSNTAFSTVNYANFKGFGLQPNVQNVEYKLISVTLW